MGFSKLPWNSRTVCGRWKVRYFNGPTNKYGMAVYDVICDSVKVIKLETNWISFTNCGTWRETQYVAYRWDF